MTWQFISISAILLLAAAVSVACMQAAWGRRKTPGAQYFAYMMLSATVWALCSALEYSTDSYELKIFWSKFQYLGISTLSVFWFLFTVDYTQLTSRLSVTNRKILAGLFVIPAITIVLAFSNELHVLIWRSIPIIQTTPHLLIEYNHGPWFWVIAAYSYVLLLAGTTALGWSVSRFPEFYRRQAASLMLGAAIPWIVNFIYLAGYAPFPGVDLTPVAFVITGSIYSLEVFRFHLFDLVPVAQDTVVESMSDGVLVIDERQRIVYANQAARSLLGIKNTQPTTLKAGVAIWPELMQVVNDGEDEHVHSHTVSLSSDRKQTRILEAHVDPLYRSRSRSAGRLILLHDVTEQKNAEEQLRLQSVALSSAPSAIVITDKDGAIQWVNPAFTRMTGYAFEEALGKNPRILKSGQHDQEFYRYMWETILAGKTWYGELTNRKKDGTLFMESATIAPVLDAGGQITHFIAIKQNITARKELERTRDDLMQAIIHDLRNPVNNILFSLEMVQRMPESEHIPAEIDSMIEISRENAWRVLGLINSILDLSRLESGNLPLILEPVVLAELVEQTIHTQTLTAQGREILILNGVGYDLPRVIVDRTLIGRVIQNLVDNAIKFTAQGTSIEISACAPVDGKEVIISVHDDGPGIPTELRGQLFQKFSTGVSQRRGSGLGLAFCRLAVEAHHGRIWVESAAGQGATFFFSLPAETAPAAEPAIGAAEGEKP